MLTLDNVSSVVSRLMARCLWIILLAKHRVMCPTSKDQLIYFIFQFLEKRKAARKRLNNNSDDDDSDSNSGQFD
jgi:hypothetical protein